MQRRALGRGDDIGRGARARGFGDLDLARRRRAPSATRCDRRPAPRATRPCGNSRRRRRCAGRRCRGRATARPARPAGRRRPDRPGRGPAWRRRRARGRCAVRANGPEMIEARDEREACARATAGRRSASGRRCRRTTTARGSSRWCRSRARAAPARRRPRRPSRRTSRRSCGSRSCGLRDGAVVDVLAGEVVGVFAHVERADQHRAGRLQPLDQRRVARGRRAVAVDLGAGAASAGRRRRTGS